MSSNVYLVGGAIGGAVTGLAMGWGARLIYVGRRMLARGAPELLSSDKRAPVLYLRPFKDDGVIFKPSLLRSRRKLEFGGLFRRTYEQKLAHVLQDIGPFIAVGNPSENRPQLGAARLYVPDAKWKSTVSQLLGKSQLIVLHAGESEGLLWELGEVFKIVDPLKIIISLPMDEKRGETIEKARYEKFRERSADIFPHPLPEADRGAQFLYFDRDWNPSLLVPMRGQQLPAMRAGGSGAGETQSRALNGLRREFLRVSSPYWVRFFLMLPIFVVGFLVVFSMWLAAFDALSKFAERTTLFGILATTQEVLDEYRPFFDKRREDFRVIAQRLPELGTAQPMPAAPDLKPRPTCDARTGEFNTEILMFEQLLSPTIDPKFPLSTRRGLLMGMQWMAESRSDTTDRAKPSLKEQLEAARRYRYVVVNRVIEYRAPKAYNAQTFDPGTVTIEGFLVDLETRRIVAVYRASAASDHELEYEAEFDARGALERRARSSMWSNTQAKVIKALTDLTGGTFVMPYR